MASTPSTAHNDVSHRSRCLRRCSRKKKAPSPSPGLEANLLPYIYVPVATLLAPASTTSGSSDIVALNRTLETAKSPVMPPPLPEYVLAALVGAITNVSPFTRLPSFLIMLNIPTKEGILISTFISQCAIVYAQPALFATTSS
jgi:hypothetical protein